MYRIIKIGMDVHSKNYTLCAMEPVIGEKDRIFANIQVTADYKNILMFIEQPKMKLGMSDEYDIQCGYEAGCLGYSLYKRDALMIAQCLSYGGYHAVYIPTQEAARAISFSPLKLLYILNNFLVFDAVN